MTINQLFYLLERNGINQQKEDSYVDIKKKDNLFEVFNVDRNDRFAIEIYNDEDDACARYIERLLGPYKIKKDKSGFKPNHLYLMWNCFSNKGYILIAIDDICDYYTQSNERLQNVVSARLKVINQVKDIIDYFESNRDIFFTYSCKFVNYYSQRLFDLSICIGNFTKPEKNTQGVIVLSDYEMKKLIT